MKGTLKIKLDTGTVLKKIDFNKYYKRISISKVKGEGNKVIGKLQLIKRRSPNKGMIVKKTFTGDIDLNEYYRKMLNRKLQEDN